MAEMERPAAAERIAVLETRLLPGRESRIDWAFFLGSSVGTLEFARTAVRVPATGARLRVGTTGLSRAAPAGVSYCHAEMNWDVWNCRKHTESTPSQTRSHCGYKKTLQRGWVDGRRSFEVGIAALVVGRR